MRFTIGSAVLLMAITAHAQETGTPFYQAIRGNDLGAVRALVQKSGVDAKDSRGTTPLMYAAAVGSLDVMKMLMEGGADVNAKNTFDATALMWAAGDIDKVRLLLSKGADVKAKSKIGRTPLLLAAFHDGASEIVRLMIDHGADVMARDKDGASGLEAAASVNDSESVRLLLSKGADANAKDAANLTPLLQAAWNGDRNAEVVKLLLEHGASSGEGTNGGFAVIRSKRSPRTGSKRSPVATSRLVMPETWALKRVQPAARGLISTASTCPVWVEASSA
jgi:ankyrin repeat protein